MKMRTLALALALAVTGSIGVAQAAAPKARAKAVKFKSTKINTKNQAKFKASHNITKRANPKAPAKHTAQKTTPHKFVKPVKHG